MAKVSGEQHYNAHHYHNNEGYRNAIISETRAARWLAEHLPNHIVSFAGSGDNTVKDIDFIVDDFRTISFKCPLAANRSGNLNFELKVLDRNTHNWINGWYNTGKADFYMFEIKGRYYVADKINVTDYVQNHGWDSVKSNTPTTVAGNAFHVHSNAKNGLVKIEKLERAGVLIPLQFQNGDAKSESTIAKILYLRNTARTK